MSYQTFDLTGSREHSAPRSRGSISQGPSTTRHLRKSGRAPRNQVIFFHDQHLTPNNIWRSAAVLPISKYP